MIAEALPYPVSPDWLLRGGYRALVVYRTDTQEAVATRSVRPVAFAEEAETRQLADGTLDDVRRVRAVAPEVASWPAVVALRRWAADGARIRAVLIAAGRAPHLLWDEPVPVLLRSFNEGRGTLSGDRLVLHTARYDAAVESSPDLLGTDLGALWAGSAERVLPAPGLTVYAVGGSVEARDRAGGVLASAAGGGALVLPAGTWSLSVTGAERPQLVTVAPFVAATGSQVQVESAVAGTVYAARTD